MSKQQLYLFDCEKQLDIRVPTAETVIGRDSILQCDDKRVSREHGIIKLDADQTGTIQITSTHSNPIFIRTEASVLEILTKDLTATLRHGEKFALLPDQYWYEVRFQAAGEEEAQSVTSTGNGTLRIRTMEEVNSSAVTIAVPRVLPDWMGGTGEKRKNADESEAESSKKPRQEEPESSSDVAVPAAGNEDADKTPVDTHTATGEKPAAEEIQMVKPDPDASEASSSSRPKSPPATEAVKTEVKEETADSTGPPPRPSCEFGIRCYRHTIDHRTQFAHPNDSDYRRPVFPPAPDDVPSCPFGASCYRRNPQHFREFQHPDSTSVAPVNRVPVHPPPPPNNDDSRRRRNRRLARDIVMAAIVNPRLFDGSDEEDDDDNVDLFDYESDSDEYRPGRESSDEEDEEEIDTQELEHEDEE